MSNSIEKGFDKVSFDHVADEFYNNVKKYSLKMAHILRDHDDFEWKHIEMIQKIKVLTDEFETELCEKYIR